MIAHLLFEQSGTFKNAFKKNGVEAFDYDIAKKSLTDITDISPHKMGGTFVPGASEYL